MSRSNLDRRNQTEFSGILIGTIVILTEFWIRTIKEKNRKEIFTQPTHTHRPLKIPKRLGKLYGIFFKFFQKNLSENIFKIIAKYLSVRN